VSIPFRTYVRIVLVVALAALVWRRWTSMSTARMIVIGLALLVLAAIIYQMASALRKSRKLRDEVPKNPLGLDS
jgi:predicted lysophospholipase L1 biosynthesis ABC-type transport system permease subunit